MDSDNSVPLRQGDYLPSVKSIVLIGSAPDELTPLGVVVITQCCDLANGKGDALVAKVVLLEGQQLLVAKSGVTARYAPVEVAGLDKYADFGASAGMRLVDLQSVARASMNEASRIRFRERVARRFGRHAFPDELQPSLKVLRDALRRAGRDEVAHRVLMNRVKAVRVRLQPDTSHWTALEIAFVLKKGELPSFQDAVDPPEDPPVADPVPATRTGTRLKDLLVELNGHAAGTQEAGRLWSQIEALLQEAVVVEAVGGQVLSASCTAIEAGDYSFQDYLDSADLDVDDLSD